MNKAEIAERFWGSIALKNSPKLYTKFKDNDTSEIDTLRGKRNATDKNLQGLRDTPHGSAKTWI